MFMRFRGGGVGHKATQNRDHVFREDILNEEVAAEDVLVGTGATEVNNSATQLGDSDADVEGGDEEELEDEELEDEELEQYWREEGESSSSDDSDSGDSNGEGDDPQSD